jgi:hypothetical protein
VDSDADAEGQGGLALGEVAVADAVGAVSGDAEGGIEPVEGLFAGPLGWPLVVVVDPVVGVQLEGLGGQLVVG